MSSKAQGFPNVDLRPPPGKAPLYERLADAIRDRVANGALKPGDRLPSIRDLARRLKIHANTVARTYADLERGGVLVTRRGAGTFVAAPNSDPLLSALREERLRAIVSRAVLEARSLGYSLGQIENALAHHLSTNARGRDVGRAGVQASPVVIVGSDDLALDLLAHRVSRESAGNRPVLSVHAGSVGGLAALARGEAHLAGVHLWDAAGGAYNLPFVARMFPKRAMTLVNLVSRQQGLMVHRRSRKLIRGLSDLIRPGVVFVNRQPGSGTRLLLDSELKRLGIDPSQIEGYEHEVSDHMAVAESVANQTADVGMGTLPPARAMGLDFILVRYERYDLVVPEESYSSDFLQPLWSVLRSREFRDAVDHLGGYDTSQTGEVVARWRPRREAAAP